MRATLNLFGLFEYSCFVFMNNIWLVKSMCLNLSLLSNCEWLSNESWSIIEFISIFFIQVLTATNTIFNQKQCLTSFRPGKAQKK